MKKIKSELLFKGKWISLFRSTFLNSRNEEYEWEHLDNTKSIHAVVMLATLKPSNRIVIIKQFRAGINKSILGMPAGMCDDYVAGKSDVGKDAIRELKEETGYVGIVTEISPVMCSMPSISSGTIQFVKMNIDENLPENIKPKQELELSEDIEVILIDKDKSKEQIIALSEKEDAMMAPTLWYLLAEK